MGKEETITEGERTLILKLYEFFEHEKAIGGPSIPLNQVTNRVCAATGVSQRTVARIRREEKEALQDLNLSMQPGSSSEDTTPLITLSTPGKNRKKRKKLIPIDDNMINGIKTILENYHTTHNEEPTLRKVCEIAKRDLGFTGQRETLRKAILEKLGHRFKSSAKDKSPLSDFVVVFVHE